MAHNYWFTTLIVLCLVKPTTCNTNTYGQEFVFVYPPNNSGARGTSAMLDIINPDTRKHAAVTVDYSEFMGTGDNVTAMRHTVTLDVKILSNFMLASWWFSRESPKQVTGGDLYETDQPEKPMFDVRLCTNNIDAFAPNVRAIAFEFNGSVILDSIKDGLHQYLDSRIVVSSSVPITLVAHSVDVTGARDSFLVLPTSMAGKTYALALPPSSPSGSSIIYFLPTAPANDQHVTINLIRKTSTCTCSQTVQISEMLAFSSSEESLTLYARSNVTFVIVAAVRGLPTTHGSNVLDFGCFMPSPVPMTTCDALSVQDDHVAQLLTGKYFLFTSPSAHCEPVEITLIGSNKYVEKKHVISGETETPKLISHNQFGNIAAMSSTAAMLNVIRYGGYNVGEVNYEEGAFLHEVPAISQFVTGMTPIVVPTESNQVLMIADYKAMSSVYFDGEISMTFAPLPFFGGSLYYASGTVQRGFHFLYADGLYTVFISGRTNGSAYGYIPAFNSRKVVKPLTTKTPRISKPSETTTMSQRATITLVVTKLTVNDSILTTTTTTMPSPSTHRHKSPTTTIGVNYTTFSPSDSNVLKSSTAILILCQCLAVFFM